MDALGGELSSSIVVDHGHKSTSGMSHITFQLKSNERALPVCRGQELEKDMPAVPSETTAAAAAAQGSSALAQEEREERVIVRRLQHRLEQGLRLRSAEGVPGGNNHRTPA